MTTHADNLSANRRARKRGQRRRDSKTLKRHKRRAHERAWCEIKAHAKSQGRKFKKPKVQAPVGRIGKFIAALRRGIGK